MPAALGFAVVAACIVFSGGFVCGSAYAQSPVAELHGQAVDEDSEPVARVEIMVANNPRAQEIYTDVAGRFEIDLPQAGTVVLSFSKPGFFRIDNREITVMPGINYVTFSLSHETELEQTVEVHSSSTQIDPETTSHQEALVQRDIVSIPVPATRDLQQSLTTMPQTVTDSGGALHIAGARQGQTEVLLDGFEINDPGTGGFSARMNVDAVQEVSVETGGYGAEYAHAGAGVLVIDTISGDDKFRFGFTNFAPGLNFQDGVQFGNWDPRIIFSGPIKKGKFWFSEAVTGLRTFGIVTELPRGQNTEIQWGGDSLFRLQANLSQSNTLQGSFLLNKTLDAHSGLGPYAPDSTTTRFDSTRSLGSLKDQIVMGHTLLEVGAAYDVGTLDNTPQGNATYVVTPSNTSGNYFMRAMQKSQRLQGIANVTAGSLAWHGDHTLSAGGNLSGLNFQQDSTRGQIAYVRADGTLSDRATFLGSGFTQMSNMQSGGYVQDHWRPVKPLVITVGARADWDSLIHRGLVEPRVAMNWVPAQDGRMKFTVAWGVHYQPLSLLILSQGFDQHRSDQFYDGTGTVPILPPTITTFVVPLRNLEQPRSYNTMAEWDDKLNPRTYLGATFLLRELNDGFAYQEANPGMFLLEDHRDDRYISGEMWVQHDFNDKTQIKIDYTRSSATSSQVLDPTLAHLIFAAQGSGPVLWDSPNRVVATGWTPIPIWDLFLSGFFEYHTGFPFTSINENQQLVGAPNGRRFPNYVSLDLGLEKRFMFRKREWAIRISGINVLAHNNPNTVVNNVDSPNYLQFAGGHTAMFSARLRLVTQP